MTINSLMMAQIPIANGKPIETVVDEVNNKLDELQTRDRSVIDELSRKIDDIVLLLGVVA